MKKLSEVEDVRRLRAVVDHLYTLIDDIDTASDAAKSNDTFYRQIVEEIQRQKNDSGVVSDGYELFLLDGSDNLTLEQTAQINRSRDSDWDGTYAHAVPKSKGKMY